MLKLSLIWNLKMSMIKYLLIFLIPSLTAFSQDTLPKHFDFILEQLDIKQDECFKELVIEKIIPYSNNESVIVIPKIAKIDGEDYDANYVFDAYIAIIENKSGRIISQFFEEKAWTSDAISLYKIEIDFAHYKLNAETRAFGVKIEYSGSSRVDPYSNDEISLFIQKDDKLERVLKNYSIKNFHG